MPRLGCASETVFRGAQYAVHVMLVALKLYHGVHYVLKYLRTGKRAFLVYMTDEYHWRAA